MIDSKLGSWMDSTISLCIYSTSNLLLGMMTIPLKISHGGPDAIGGRDEPTDCHCGLLAQIHQVPGLWQSEHPIQCYMRSEIPLKYLRFSWPPQRTEFCRSSCSCIGDLINLVDWWVRADLTETENRNPSEVAKAHWPLPVGSFILPAGCSAGLPSAVNRCSMKKHDKPWPRSMWRWGIVNGGQWWFNGACWACLVGARVWSVPRISSQNNHDMNFASCAGDFFRNDYRLQALITYRWLCMTQLQDALPEWLLWSQCHRWWKEAEVDGDAPFFLGKGQEMRGHIETVERIFTSKASLRSGRIFGYFWLQNFCPGGMAAKSCTKPGFLMFWCAWLVGQGHPFFFFFGIDQSRPPGWQWPRELWRPGASPHDTCSGGKRGSQMWNSIQRCRPWSVWPRPMPSWSFAGWPRKWWFQWHISSTALLPCLHESWRNWFEIIIESLQSDSLFSSRRCRMFSECDEGWEQTSCITWKIHHSQATMWMMNRDVRWPIKDCMTWLLTN